MAVVVDCIRLVSFTFQMNEKVCLTSKCSTFYVVGCCVRL